MKKRPSKKLPKKNSINQKNNNMFKIVNVLAVLTIVAIVSIGLLYPTEDENKSNKLEINKTLDIIKKETIKDKPKEITYEEKTKALDIEYSTTPNNNFYVEKPKPKNTTYNKFTYEEPMDKEMDNIDHIVNKIDIPEIIKIEEIKDERVFQETKEKKEKTLSNKPKLIIIIDDVTSKWQIEKIKDIGYKVNMAFLPPTKGHKNSAKVTKQLDNYIIHLPLQASNSKYEEEKTLYITDTLMTIESRIVALQKLYPRAKFINNHTGSKFTSNQIAMDKLFRVLKKYNYTFIDSRTTAASVAKLSAKKYGVRMFSRNIFLDNKKDKKYILRQLKRAMALSKKYGHAIAIGHPYGVTFSTLKSAKNILKDFDLIYVEQL